MNSNLDAAAAPVAAGRPVPHPTVDQPRRSRVAALLAAAAPVAAALVALGAAPLAAASIGAHVDAAHPSTVLAGDDPCKTTLTAGALNTMKYPVCAGD